MRILDRFHKVERLGQKPGAAAASEPPALPDASRVATPLVKRALLGQIVVALRAESDRLKIKSTLTGKSTEWQQNRVAVCLDSIGQDRITYDDLLANLKSLKSQIESDVRLNFPLRRKLPTFFQPHGSNLVASLIKTAKTGLEEALAPEQFLETPRKR